VLPAAEALKFMWQCVQNAVFKMHVKY